MLTRKRRRKLLNDLTSADYYHIVQLNAHDIVSALKKVRSMQSELGRVEKELERLQLQCNLSQQSVIQPNVT